MNYELEEELREQAQVLRERLEDQVELLSLFTVIPWAEELRQKRQRELLETIAASCELFYKILLKEGESK